MNAHNLASRALVAVGGIAMLVGAIDPLEGAVLILAGSCLIALGALFGQNEGRVVAYRALVFALIALGVAALWWLSRAGGIGVSSGVSPWWAMLMLPYPIGWSMGVWGPGSPRWMLLSGIGVGLWYVGLLAIALGKGMHVSTGIVIAVVGVLTIGGCIISLVHSTRRPMTAN